MNDSFIGQSLLHYQVTAKLGEGGMGAVYLATDSNLGRPVALKFLPDDMARDPERVARFDREARTLAALQHGNIAAIHGIEEVEGRRFLVMEYVDGEDLQERLGRGPLPLDEVVPIARQMAEGLEAAHEAGIVHRDLKPANVKMATDGTVKVLDFGLARPVTESGDPVDLDHSPTITQAMTHAGTILGTAAYMSPEQARGKGVDKRADIWAFGVIVYELLTGQQLFAGDTLSDTMAGVLKNPIDIDTLPSDTPPSLRRLLERCLDRDPRMRLRDIGEARVLLERPAPAEQTTARASSSSRVPWIVLGLLIGTFATFAGLQLSTSNEPVAPRQSQKFEIPIDPGDNRVRLAFDPQGTRLLYPDQGVLWVRHLNEVESRLVTGSNRATIGTWSPDGEWIAYAAATKLYKSRPDGTGRFVLCDIDRIRDQAGGLAWLADGDIVYSSGAAGLNRVSSQGGTPREWIDPTEDEVDFHYATVLPDGESVLFGPHSVNDISKCDVFVNGVRSTVLHEPGYFMGEVAYSRGFLVYALGPTNRGLRAAPFSLETMRTTGEGFVLVPGAEFPAASEHGHLAYSFRRTDEIREVVILNSAGEVIRTVIPEQSGLGEELTMSPDGGEVAVSIEGDDSDIWIFEVDSGVRRRFAFGDGNQHNPAWSPTGDKIAYVVGGSMEGQLFLKETKTMQTTEIPVPRPENVRFSPNGDLLLLTVNDEQLDDDIAYFDLEKNEATMYLETDEREWFPALSPTGEYLAFASSTTGRAEIYIQEFPQGEVRWQVSHEGGTRPVWSAAGTELYFQDGRRVMVVTVDTVGGLSLGQPNVLFEQQGIVYVEPTSNPGEFMAIRRVSEDQRPPAITVWLNWDAGLETAGSSD